MRSLEWDLITVTEVLVKVENSDTETHIGKTHREMGHVTE